MLVTEHMLQGTIVLTLSGRFGQSHDPVLENALLKGTDQRTKQIVFNLEKVSSIDSTGIGLIFLTFYRLEQIGINLRLVNPKPEVRKLLDLVKIPLLIPLFNSNEEAVTAQPPQVNALQQSSKKKVPHRSRRKAPAVLFNTPTFGVSA